MYRDMWAQWRMSGKAAFTIYLENGTVKGTQEHGRVSRFFFYPDELVALRDAIDATLRYYEEVEADSYIVNAWNTRASDEAYEAQQKVEQAVVKPPMFVYVIHDTANGFYKIGSSQTPNTRERTLQAEKPTLEMLVSFPASREDERILQKHFADKKIRGEWFRLDNADLQYITDYFSVDTEVAPIEEPLQVPLKLVG